MTAERWLRHARDRARRIRRDPARAAVRVGRRAVLGARQLAGRPLVSAAERAEAAQLREGPALAPADALAENGFTVFRGLFSPDECRDLAARLKAAAGVTDGVTFTRTDATNKVPITREVLLDERVLAAVRSCVGERIRFLQTSDLHYRHDTAGWHRDSVHRELDNTGSADWSVDGAGEAFSVVKAILYLETDNAAMGLMAGSHLSPIAIDHDLVRSAEKRGEQTVVDAGDDPNRAFGAGEKRLPVVWRAQVGDLLVFDQRTYHAGRRVDDGRVSARTDSAKFALSFVYGRDNRHSERFYSYFRYARRELGYRRFPADFEAALVAHDLLLDAGQANYYEAHPEDLRLATLRNPADVEDLIARFTRTGSAVGTRDQPLP